MSTKSLNLNITGYDATETTSHEPQLVSPLPVPTSSQTITEEDQEKYREMRRLGLSDFGYKHLESLVSNENLSLIRDIRTAHTWHISSVGSCLDVMKQDLQVRGKNGCAVELRLREILHHHMYYIDIEERNSNMLNSILS